MHLVRHGLLFLFFVVILSNYLYYKKFQVREICNQNKTSKGKAPVGVKTPQFVEICDHIKNIMDQGETVSPQLLAKLIKFKLLMIKSKDIDRREEEKKVLKLKLLFIYTVGVVLINVFSILIFGN